jgi:hypothetical protein
MTSEQRRGRTISLVIAVGLVAINVLLFLLAALVQPETGAFQWFRLGLVLALAWCVFKGYGWARAYVAFSMLVCSLLWLVGPILAGQPIELVIGVPLSAIFITGAVVLWRSKSVAAYFDHQTQRRDAPLSMKGVDEL